MLQAHERLGDFEILRPLGKGGMGEVYEARQFNPERPVALKVLAPWLAQDPEALRRFWQEAQVPANLDHPGIVRIISTGTTPNGVAYYTMHLVRGISLAEMIRRANAEPLPETVSQADPAVDTPSRKTTAEGQTGPDPAAGPNSALSPPLFRDYLNDRYATVARIGAQAARALAYAHGQGFLHRDIKPSNLMIDQHGQVYLVDFGLTRALGPDGNGTQPGFVPGTPCYMSPEQANGQPLDARSDIYSLGVTLYQLATQGLGPFPARAADKRAVLEQVRAGRVMPVSMWAPDIPPGLEQIIRKAMHFHPEQRYASAAELARDLEGFPGAAPAGASDPRPAPPLPFSSADGREQARALRDPALSRADLPPPARPLWPLVGAGTAAGLALVAAITLVLLRSGPGVGEANPKSPALETSLPAPRALDGRHAFPESLRSAQLNVPNALMKVNWSPLWAERLYGSGEFKLYRNQLELSSPSKDMCTILALADPDRPCFEFAVELNQMRRSKIEKNDLGLVFGWRRQPEDPDHPPRFFVVQLDEEPPEAGATGRLTIGTAWLLEKQGARAASIEWYRPLPAGKATLPLVRTGPAYPWRTVKVKIQGERVEVSVDQVPARDFTLTWLRQTTPEAAANLSTAGAVGIWASGGRGFFRKATLTLLPAE